MQIKLVNTITKWCIWPVGVESKLHFKKKNFLVEELGEEICFLFFFYAQVKGMCSYFQL